MTDNEFIKAIKWCSENDHCNTSRCPVFHDGDADEACMQKIIKYILDLIKRKDAEIDGLYKTLDKQILENHSLKAEIAHKNAIIEAVLDTVHDLGDDLARALENPNTTNSVKHSKWKINCDGYYPYCPECGAEPKGGIMTKYCAECGAQMEGCVM